jgi:hypothetical protein
MTSLSVLEGGIYVVCANPIFPITDLGNIWVFEVLESDATDLKQRLGRMDEYCTGQDGTFTGVLEQIEMCSSTHPGLRLLREKPTLRGVMTIHKSVSQARH